jgi:hypothetical protein
VERRRNEALGRVNVKRQRHESHRPTELLREVGQQRVIGASHAASIAAVLPVDNRRCRLLERLSARRCRHGGCRRRQWAILAR